MTIVSESSPTAGGASDPADWVRQHGDALYRFALLRLGNPDLAEEAVQEALLAALSARSRFEGAASERTWLIGILRNKIVDQIRRRQRQASQLLPVDDAETNFEQGLWRTRPTGWADPTVARAHAAEFRAAVSRCVASLPSPQREALCLCELDGLSAAEAADLLGVSVNNVWTLVHRAKLRLRQQLDPFWLELK